MRRLCLTLGIVVLASRVLTAQVAVTDPAVTLRNTITAILHQYLVETEQAQHRQLRRWSRRLSMFTDLQKYALPDPPRWRTHDFENPEAFLFARAYHAALNYGDAHGDAYLAVSHPLNAATGALAQLDPGLRRGVLARLASIEATDAAAIAATDQTGRSRFNGRRELAAITALETDVLDPSGEQSATAVLDKISGALLVGGRQRQTRTQLLASVLEQLVVESKRARDTEAVVMNLQLVTWRDGRAANAAFVAGTGDALRTWRQP
jgi:hypothetical protein